MAETKAYKVWRDRIDSGTMTKSECQQYARVVVSLCETHHTSVRTNLTYEEACSLRDQMDSACGVNLTDSHTAQGLAWLERYATSRLPQLPLDWRDRFVGFKFAGEGIDCGRGGWPAYVPVWRIVLRSQDARQRFDLWDYAATAWQAAEQFERAWKVAS